MKKKMRLRASIPLLMALAVLVSCSQDGATPQERFAVTQAALPASCPGAAPTSACQAIDDFTAPVTTLGWKSLPGLTPGGSGDITATLATEVKNIAVVSCGVAQPTIYIPHGHWTISHTIQLEYGYGINIVGEDPATTFITWAGPTAYAIAPTHVAAVAGVHGEYWIDNNTGADMFRLIDVGAVKFSRLTLDGNGSARIGVQMAQTRCYQWPNDQKYRCGLQTPISGAVAVGVTATGIELNDDVFKNMSYGVVANETTLLGDDNRSVQLDAGLGVVQPDPVGGTYPLDVGLPSISNQNLGDVLIRRSTFNTIAQQGVCLGGSNTYDWLIADSEFSSCFRGVEVVISGGTSVINSRFIGNGLAGTAVDGITSGATNADNSVLLTTTVLQGMDLYFSGDVPEMVRGNYSYGSRKFLSASVHGSVGAVDVTGNYAVTSPPGTGALEPIITSTLTQLTLFDNYLGSTTAGVTAVLTYAPAGGSGAWNDRPRIAHGGNHFQTDGTTGPACTSTCTNALSYLSPCAFIHPFDTNPAYGGLASEVALGDDDCSTTTPVNTPAQKANAFLCAQIPPTPLASTHARTVYDVSLTSQILGGSTYNIGDVCSAVSPTCSPASPTVSCSDLVNAWLAARPVGDQSFLFWPAKDYNFDKTIEVPAGLDVVIAGDGVRTRFIWKGVDTTKPDAYMFHLAAPSHATLRDFTGAVNVAGTTRAGGILVDSHDDVDGALVFADTLQVGFSKSFVDLLGLDKVAVRADLSGGGSLERVLGVTGGGKANPASGDSSSTKGFLMFAGGGGSQANFIDLKNWGKAVLVGVDNEATYSGMALDQSGYLTLVNGRMLPKKQLATYNTIFADQPNTIIRSSFRGRATFMSLTSLIGDLSASGATSGASVLALDNWFGTASLASSPLQPQLINCPNPGALNPLDCSFAVQLASTPSPVTQMELQGGTACVPTAGVSSSYCTNHDQGATQPAIAAFVGGMLRDDRAALAVVDVPTSACAGTQVRVHRVTLAGNPSSIVELMGPGLRVQRN